MKSTTYFNDNGKFRAAAIFCAFFSWSVFLSVSNVDAQSSTNSANSVNSTSSSVGGSRYLHRPSLPTGELAFFQRVGGKTDGRLQPFAFKTPENVRVGIAAEGRYVANDDGSNAFAFAIGAVYRLQITNIPYSDRALYPTLETLGRLNPPSGKEWDFPIEIFVSQEDLDLALAGKMVTRVVFVENSDAAPNVDSSVPGNEIRVDIPAGLDPIAAAERRGRVVAILRMGSRAPFDLPNVQDPFYFGLPGFALKQIVPSSTSR